MSEMSHSGTNEGRSGSGPPKGPWHHTLEVRIDGRGVESAIRLFKKLILRDGILKEFKRRAHYEKPGEKRRRKVREAARRRRRQRAREVRREQGQF
jgi:small subunit ribosomal protein S21